MKAMKSEAAGVVFVLLLCGAAGASAWAQGRAEPGAKKAAEKSADRSTRDLGDHDDLVIKPAPKPSPRAAADPSDETRVDANPAPAAPAPDSAKRREGVTRFCLVTPRAQLSGGDPAQAAEAMRGTFESFLNGPTVETAPLNSRLPSQALEEARRAGCDYVLHTSLIQKRGGGGGGGLFGKALGGVAASSVYSLPGGSSAAGTLARSAAISGANAAAEFAANIKARDELILEYRLEAAGGGGAPLTKTEKAKSKRDGEDLLTPLVERAAASIAAAAARQ